MKTTVGTPAIGSALRAVLASLSWSDADLGDTMGDDIRAAYDDLSALTAKAAALDALVEAATSLVAHAQEAYPHFEDTRGQADIAATLAALSAAKAAQVQS